MSGGGVADWRGSARMAVIGLGYVGLPLAVEFGKRFPVTGIDVKPSRIAELSEGRDATLQGSLGACCREPPCRH